MKTILLLDPALDQSLATAKFLKTKSSDFKVTAGIEAGKYFSREKKCFYDNLLIIKADEDYRALLRNFDFIIPTGTNSTGKMCRSMPEVLTPAITFSAKNIALFDKVSSICTARELGIPTPESFSINDDLINFPVFYKQSIETGGGRRGRLDTISQYNKLSNKDNLIFQEYILGKGTYAVGFIARDGSIIASSTYFESLSLPRDGGSAVFLESYSDPRLIEYTLRLAKHYMYNGWGLAEYKYCPRRNDFVFMEVNAKLWASIEFVYLNNPEFLELIFGIKYKKESCNAVFFPQRALFAGHYGPFFKNILFKRPTNICYAPWQRFIKVYLSELIKSMILK